MILLHVCLSESLTTPRSPSPLRECAALTMFCGNSLPAVLTSSIPAIYNKMYANLPSPAVLVYAGTADDVVTVLNIATAFNQTVAVRSAAGHSYAAQSTSTGIVLSLQNLVSMSTTLDPVTK